MTRNTRIAVTKEELETIKAAKAAHYGEDTAEDRPHAEFILEAVEQFAGEQ